MLQKEFVFWELTFFLKVKWIFVDSALCQLKKSEISENINFNENCALMPNSDGIILTSNLIIDWTVKSFVVMLINHPNGGKSQKSDQKLLAIDNSMGMIKYLNSSNISKICITWISRVTALNFQNSRATFILAWNKWNHFFFFPIF